MLAAFFAARILLFVYMFQQFATYADIPIWAVPFNIPKKCTVVTLCIFGVQVYWFSQILNGAKKILWDKKYSEVDVGYQPFNKCMKDC